MSRRGSSFTPLSPSLKVTLERDAIEWKDFATKYGKQNLGRRISTSQKIAQTAVWIRKYSIRDNLIADIIAGFTISVLHIPQGMAYGLLAGVGPINGLYVSFFPVLIYCLMGTSRHISIGTFAVVSLMLNSAATKLGAVNMDSEHHVPHANTTVLVNSITNESTTNGDLYDWPPTSLEALT
ncbi:solute carrier family 26 member 10-like protein, partial [Leptotrombidium deliense]